MFIVLDASSRVLTSSGRWAIRLQSARRFRSRRAAERAARRVYGIVHQVSYDLMND
ncbi:MAG TPA: hypothetical protein VJN96_12905 [Vicinamibacterales bacterium]|nr:hypothetical protein [Vicinamibacterales bacterium]